MRSTRPLVPASVAAALIVSGLTGAAIAQDKGMHSSHGANPQMVQQMFATLDADGDGKVSAAEMAAGPQRRFDVMDADGDGKVSATEMVEHRVARMRAHVEARVAGMIAKMDDDGDGTLSAVEMSMGRRAERKAEKHHARMFDRMDADDDGFVSLQEAQEGAASMAKHGRRGYDHGKGGEGRGAMMHHGGGGDHDGMRHGMGMGSGDCPMSDDK